MERFITHQYVAVSWREVIRLARLDKTPTTEIFYSACVELVHRTEWWAWWSDQLLTTAIGLPEDLWPQGLSADAEALITDIWASDSDTPECGWSVLARVRRILRCESLPPLQGRDRDFGTWEQLTVEFQDGQTGELYRFWAGHENGYQCEIRTDPPG